VRARFSIFVAVVQSILLLVHLVLYLTWKYFWGPLDPSTLTRFQIIVSLLSISFVAASLLAFRYSNIGVRMFYTLAALWLSLVNFLFLVACACWLLYAIPAIFGAHLQKRTLLETLSSAAVLATLYGVANASWTRVKRINVKLTKLPESWRGRTAALVSDLHLGHVRNRSFVRRIVRMLIRLRPDVLFIAGDLYDGTAVDLERVTSPWEQFSAPLGSYFVTGNHEQFSSPEKVLAAVQCAGIHVLNSEKIILDGLQIVGIHYADSVNAQNFRSILKRTALDTAVASILLVHTPDRLQIAAEEGISLQLCGHTHRGQFFPFTMIVSRIYHQFAYGLQRLGNLTVYTSCGAGTWGPPMRVGSNPEIVLIRFE
jgi:uncharacterized protein